MKPKTLSEACAIADGWTFDGEMWKVPDGVETNVAPSYRLYDANLTERFKRKAIDEGFYTDYLIWVLARVARTGVLDNHTIAEASLTIQLRASLAVILDVPAAEAMGWEEV